MNQILNIENKNNKYKLTIFFKFQFIICFAVIIILFIYVFNENDLKKEEEIITDLISQNAQIMDLFESKEIIENNSKDENGIYFCKLKIEKINLEYFVYEECTKELLKILPCKFYGGDLENSENICIVGHNYFDDRFFGNLDEIEIGDKITLENLNGKVYNYYAYEIYEVYESEISKVIDKDVDEKTLTLCTCTFIENKRLIVKAKRE